MKCENFSSTLPMQKNHVTMSILYFITNLENSDNISFLTSNQCTFLDLFEFDFNKKLY